MARGSVHNAGAVARTKRMFRRAFETQARGDGFTFVEVLTMCPTGWFVPTADGPAELQRTLAEVHVMGELKVDGVIRTTEELQRGEHRPPAGDRGAPRRRRPARLTSPPSRSDSSALREHHPHALVGVGARRGRSRPRRGERLRPDAAHATRSCATSRSSAICGTCSRASVPRSVSTSSPTTTPTGRSAVITGAGCTRRRRRSTPTSGTAPTTISSDHRTTSS